MQQFLPHEQAFVTAYPQTCRPDQQRDEHLKQNPLRHTLGQDGQPVLMKSIGSETKRPSAGLFPAKTKPYNQFDHGGSPVAGCRKRGSFRADVRANQTGYPRQGAVNSSTINAGPGHSRTNGQCRSRAALDRHLPVSAARRHRRRLAGAQGQQLHRGADNCLAG